jgi:DNA-binding IclR family transcriptional regulator
LSTDVKGKPKNGEALGIQSLRSDSTCCGETGAPMNLKVLAEAAGYAPPKAHRYLVSLIRMKLVSQDPVSGRYGLGELAFELGVAAIGLLGCEGIGRRTMLEIMVESSHTTCLVVWANGGATFAAFEPGVGSIFVGIRVG